MNAHADLPLGLIYGLSNEAYQTGEGVSNSGLSLMAKSPAHYFGKKLDPRRPAEEAKGGQLAGSLMHCALLEPAEFDSRYSVGPTVNRNTKVWKEYCEAHPGFECIQAEQRDEAFGQADSLRRIPEVAALLATGKPEVSVYWIDDVTGELCRCRPDWVHPVGDQGVILFDGKTYSDASSWEFGRQIARKGYHRQAAWYSDGYTAATGVPVLGFVFGAVETEWPFVSCAHILDDQSLDKGRAENRELLNRYAECRRTNNWPGYAAEIQTITLPSWAL